MHTSLAQCPMEPSLLLSPPPFPPSFSRKNATITAVSTATSMLPPRCCRARAMCSMGSSRQRRDVTHDGAGVRTQVHSSSTPQGQPRTRACHCRTHVGVYPHPGVPPRAPLEGVPKFRGWVWAALGSIPTPHHPRVRKRMVKEEEEGGFHSNCLQGNTGRNVSAEPGMLQGGDQATGWH